MDQQLYTEIVWFMPSKVYHQRITDSLTKTSAAIGRKYVDDGLLGSVFLTHPFLDADSMPVKILQRIQLRRRELRGLAVWFVSISHARAQILLTRY